jgi:hypothetical protein
MILRKTQRYCPPPLVVMTLQSLMVIGGSPLDLLATSCAPATESNGSVATADLSSSLRFIDLVPRQDANEVKNLSAKLQAKSLVDGRSLERREILIYG